MNESKRLYWMLGIVVLLIIANMTQYMGEGGGDSAGFFSNVDDLSAAYTPAIQRKMTIIDGLPHLNFRTNKEAREADGDLRNPFTFGVDKARERENQERLERLAEARAEMEAARDAAEEEAAQEEAAPVQPRFEGKVIGVMRNTETGSWLLSVLYEDEYFILEPGETLNERLTLVDVTEERARFLHRESSQNIDIPLTSY